MITMKKILFASICLLLFSDAFSQTLIFNPVADNTIFSENTGNSNGAGANFFVGEVGGSGGFGKRRALIKFNVSAIPAGSVVTGVSLQVFCTNVPPGSAANTVELHNCQAAWGEGTSSGLGSGAAATLNDATWNCSFANGGGGCSSSWSIAGGTFDPAISSSVTVIASGNYTFPGSAKMIADVQSWINAPATNAGWLLKGNETTPLTARGFYSREGNATASVLTVTFNPSLCPGENVWTGAVDNAWENAANWSCGSVPDLNTNVTINSGTVNLNSNRSCRSIHINPAVNFKVTAGFNLTVVN